MEWSEPGFAFRVTSKKIIAESVWPILGKETDYDRLRTITNDYERLDENEKVILLYLLDNKTISRKIAVNLLKFQKTKTYEVLNAIVEKGLLIRKGKERSTYYVLGKINKD